MMGDGELCSNVHYEYFSRYLGDAQIPCGTIL